MFLLHVWSFCNEQTTLLTSLKCLKMLSFSDILKVVYRAVTCMPIPIQHWSGGETLLVEVSLTVYKIRHQNQLSNFNVMKLDSIMSLMSSFISQRRFLIKMSTGRS